MDTLKRARPAEGNAVQPAAGDEEQYGLDKCAHPATLLTAAQPFFWCRYEEYVPIKKRRALEQQQRLARLKKVLLLSIAAAEETQVVCVSVQLTLSCTLL